MSPAEIAAAQREQQRYADRAAVHTERAMRYLEEAAELDAQAAAIPQRSTRPRPPTVAREPIGFPTAIPALGIQAGDGLLFLETAGGVEVAILVREVPAEFARALAAVDSTTPAPTPKPMGRPRLEVLR